MDIGKIREACTLRKIKWSVPVAGMARAFANCAKALAISVNRGKIELFLHL